jgi:MFS family permease
VTPAPPQQSRQRNAALLIGVSLVSGFGGTAMSLVAGVWVMDLTGSATLASLAGFCVFLPTLFGPLLGAIVDRVPRRPLLIWTNLLVAASLLLLLAVRSQDQVWLLYTVMLAYGVSYVLLDAGEAALLPAALGEDQLGRVNGYRMSAQEGAKLLAPLLGAALFTVVGGAAVAALAAAMLLTAAVLYRFVRADDFRPAAAPRPLRTATWEGVQYLRHHPNLLAIVLIGALAMATSGLTTAPLSLVVSDGLGLPPAFLGILSSAQGAGALAGGLLTGRLLTRHGEARVATWGALLLAAGTAARLLPYASAVVASSALIGLGLPWTVIAALTAVQTRTPTALLGRVAATANTLVFAPTAIAIPLGAALLTITPYQPLLLTIAALTALTTAPLAARATRSAATINHPKPTPRTRPTTQ